MDTVFCSNLDADTWIGREVARPVEEGKTPKGGPRGLGSNIFCGPSMTKLQALNQVGYADLVECQCFMLRELFRLKVVLRVGSQTCKHCTFKRNGTAMSKPSRDLSINEVDVFELEPLEVVEGALFCLE
ncbi:hypothetical protein ABBQ38_008516 [Trebouxia sp. C0009 RCD-2024]